MGSQPHRAAAALDRFRAAIGDRYEVDGEIGHGAMATVYRARDLRAGRPVAVKVLRAEVAATLGPTRFLREIRFAGRMTHPNILPLLDAGDAAGLPYYVMPCVDGGSLRDALDRRGALPVDEAVALARGIAAGLHHAHATGVVHRDIKPQNLLLHEGRALIADFGIARAVDAAAGALAEAGPTTVGVTVGTPAYMSPEQATSDDQIDGRSDVYSLGVVLYEMIAGTPPFVGASSQTIIARRFVETPPPLAALDAGVPPHVSAAVAAALALDPGDRPATAAAFSGLLLGDTPDDARHG